MEQLEHDGVAGRRKFLKKAAYVAPAVFALGSLTAPMTANASLIAHRDSFTCACSDGTAKNVTAWEMYETDDGGYTDSGGYAFDDGTSQRYTREEIASSSWLQTFFDILFGRA